MDGRTDGRMDGRTNGRTDGWADSPCVLQDFVPFEAAALLPLNLNHTLLKQGTGAADHLPPLGCYSPFVLKAKLSSHERRFADHHHVGIHSQIEIRWTGTLHAGGCRALIKSCHKAIEGVEEDW